MKMNIGKSVKFIVLLLLMLVTLFYAIPWTFLQLSSAKAYSGIDLHAYWYSGLFFRQHINPYSAILNNPNPNYWDPRRPGSGDPNMIDNSKYSLSVPIEFIDGAQISSYPVAQVLITPPSVTAPLALLLWLFSWVSWPLAQSLWVAINFIVAASIPWLALRLPFIPSSLRPVDRLIFAFAFYSLYGVRQGIVVGQQTLVCLFLLMISLNLRKNWLISGILFGLALSKYSVALPVFVFYLMHREYRILLTGIAVQVAGILLLMTLQWGTPFETITAYLKVLDVHSGQSGVHILSTFSGSFLSYSAVAIVVITTLLLLIQHFRLNKFSLIYDLTQLNKLNILILAVLLVTYHRIYDMSLVVFFFLVLLVDISNSERATFGWWGLFEIVFLFFSVIFLIYPTFLGKFLAKIGISNAATITWLTPEGVSTIILLFIFLFSYIKFRNYSD